MADARATRHQNGIDRRQLSQQLPHQFWVILYNVANDHFVTCSDEMIHQLLTAAIRFDRPRIADGNHCTGDVGGSRSFMSF